MFDRQCLARNEKCEQPYCGRQDGLHILSSKSAAGDEIGWVYVNFVSSNQSSIKGVRDHFNSCYALSGSNVQFMCRTTFTNWLFSWLVNFKTDFR